MIPIDYISAVPSHSNRDPQPAKRAAPNPRTRRASSGGAPATGHASAARGAASGKSKGRGAGRAERGWQRMYDVIDKLMHEAIAQLLLMLAIMIFVGSAYAFATHAMSVENGMNAIGYAMMGIVVVEIMKTVHLRFEKSIRRIQMLLKVGIASAMREVLFSSAELSFDHSRGALSWHLASLLAGTTMVVCFSASLMLLRNSSDSTGKLRRMPSGGAIA